MSRTTSHDGPPAFHLLAKPTGAACNLACDYCFYLPKGELYPGGSFRMDDQLLELYLRQLIDAHRTDEVTVAWQGGEPTLMGLDFFRRGIELERRFARPGMRFLNTIQTNGTLLDDDWCTFLKEHEFLVGISIDGPAELHDAFRRDRGGHPTFGKVMRGLRLLQEHGVDYNVLTTVNRLNADHPLEVYRFLRDEVGTDWIQLIPIVEPLSAETREVAAEPPNAELSTGDDPTALVTTRSVTPEQWGGFLCTVFDEWVRRDVGDMFVQTFEATLRNWLRLPSGMCVFTETCGLGPVLEHNGDLYMCDHFVDPEHLLGSVRETPMGDLVASSHMTRFGADKRDALPRQCRECDVRFACLGECPKNRLLTTADGEPGLNYLCAGYLRFFHHVDHEMRLMADLVARGREAREVMPLLAAERARLEAAFAAAGRNDPCPCGSGRKYKHCHGR